MGGFFGTISSKDCVNDLFYGTDYNSHLGTRRAGLVTFNDNFQIIYRHNSLGLYQMRLQRYKLFARNFHFKP